MIQFLILVLSMVILVGCAASQHKAPRSADDTSRVQLLGFDGCPNTPVMKQRLRSALDQLGIDWPLEYIDQQALEPDDLRRGWPAPTVLVDGQDLFGMAWPQSPSMGCRMYAGPSGVPSVDELIRRLQRVRYYSGASNQ